jgi:hypothetical protein
VTEGIGGGNPMSNVALMSRGGADTIEAGTEAITFSVTAVFALGAPAGR